MSGSIRLELPVRSKPGKNNFNIKTRKVEQWISSLPMANLGETARLIYSVLTETNSLNYSYQDRLSFLEKLREPVQYVTDSMKKHFVGITFPLPEKNHKVAAATREILNAMATAYKIALEDLSNNHSLFSDKKQLALLVHRAISYSSRVLLSAYQVYAPYPKNTWYELHQLYRFAESRKILKQAISDNQHRFVNKTTIVDEYLRALLLALTSPYHMRLGEIGKVYDSLERWTSHCRLLSFDDASFDSNNNYFVASLDHDIAPYPMSLMNTNHTTSNDSTIFDTTKGDDSRLIDTSSLASVLKKEIKESEDVVTTTLTGIDMSHPNLSQDLLKRLLIAWGLMSKRHFPRNDKEEKVKITLGLSATHDFISQRRKTNNAPQSQQPASFDNVAHFKSSEVIDLNEEQPDVWNMVYPNSQTSNYEFPATGLGQEEKKDLTRIKTHEDELKPRYRVDNWVILNESANGYCIERLNGENTTVQVGELIGIKRGMNGHSWKWGIGVIRWMRVGENKNLQVGIEMMNPDAAAIGLRSTSGKDNFQRTLMLPALSAINQPATLITGPVPWREGNRVTLRILGKEMPVTLTKSIQNTGHFAQFQFRLENETSKQSSTPHSELDDKDLSNVWNSL